MQDVWQYLWLLPTTSPPTPSPVTTTKDISRQCPMSPSRGRGDTLPSAENHQLNTNRNFLLSLLPNIDIPGQWSAFLHTISLHLLVLISLMALESLFQPVVGKRESTYALQPPWPRSDKCHICYYSKHEN